MEPCFLCVYFIFYFSLIAWLSKSHFKKINGKDASPPGGSGPSSLVVLFINALGYCPPGTPASVLFHFYWLVVAPRFEKMTRWILTVGWAMGQINVILSSPSCTDNGQYFLHRGESFALGSSLLCLIGDRCGSVWLICTAAAKRSSLHRGKNWRMRRPLSWECLRI